MDNEKQKSSQRKQTDGAPRVVQNSNTPRSVFGETQKPQQEERKRENHGVAAPDETQIRGPGRLSILFASATPLIQHDLISHVVLHPRLVFLCFQWCFLGFCFVEAVVAEERLERKLGMFLGHEQSDPANVHQRVGTGNIRLIHYPPAPKVERYKSITERAPPEVAVTMFVGQIPNMMPLPYLAWSIDAICGQYVIESLKHARKSGCAVAFVRPDVLDVVLSKSRSILFDVHGLWYPDPSKPEQLEFLHAYCTELRSGEYPEVHADGRVPKGCIVFEEMGKPKLSSQAAPDLGHLQTRDRVRPPRQMMPPYVMAAPPPWGSGGTGLSAEARSWQPTAPPPLQ